MHVYAKTRWVCQPKMRTSSRRAARAGTPPRRPGPCPQPPVLQQRGLHRVAAGEALVPHQVHCSRQLLELLLLCAQAGVSCFCSTKSTPSWCLPSVGYRSNAPTYALLCCGCWTSRAGREAHLRQLTAPPPLQGMNSAECAPWLVADRASRHRRPAHGLISAPVRPVGVYCVQHAAVGASRHAAA